MIYRILRGDLKTFHVTPILLFPGYTEQPIIMDFGLAPMILQPISVAQYNTLLVSKELQCTRAVSLTYKHARECLKLGEFLQGAQMSWWDAVRMLFGFQAEGWTCANFASELLFNYKLDSPDELLDYIDRGDD